MAWRSPDSRYRCPGLTGRPSPLESQVLICSFALALGLTWRDVRFAERTIRVQGQGVETTKGHRRVVPIGQALAHTLVRHRETVLAGAMTPFSRASFRRKPQSVCSPELLSGSAGRTLWYTISGAHSRCMRLRAVFPSLAFSVG
jgi:hypothetical protein